MLDRLTIRYSEREDRLELRILTREPAREYWFHLTRRVTRDWLAQLARMVEMSADVPPGVDPATKRAIAASHHEALASQVTYQRDVAKSGQLERVTGDTPELVSRVECGRRKDGQRWLLRFRYGDRQSVGLTVTSATLHGVIELLRRRLEQCQWGLAFLPSADAKPGGGTKRIVH